MNRNVQTSLDRMTLGDVATVVRVDGDDPIARRLVDLGFWPGTMVHAVRKAPLGDPVQYNLRGFRLALRRDEASRILVEPSASLGAVAGSRRPAGSGPASLGDSIRAFFGLSRPAPAVAPAAAAPAPECSETP